MKKNNVVKGIRKCFVASVLRGPYYLLYVLTLGFMVCIFLLPDGETLKMLNVAFPVVAIVTGISFSWAQCLQKGVFKANVLHASKRFFHSLILLFIHRMAIAQKEANETSYCLELLNKAEYITNEMFDSAIIDLQEIQKLLSSIIMTSKSRAKI